MKKKYFTIFLKKLNLLFYIRTAIGTRKITQFTFMRFGIQMNTIGMFPETGLSPKFFGTKLAFVFSFQILMNYIIMHSQFGGNFEYSGTSRSGAWVSLAAICTWVYCHFMLPEIFEKFSQRFCLYFRFVIRIRISNQTNSK